MKYKASTSMVRNIFLYSLFISLIMSAYSLTTETWIIDDSDLANIQEPFPDSSDARYQVIWGTNYVGYIFCKLPTPEHRVKSYRTLHILDQPLLL